MDFRDELAELDAQARRGEIPLAEYFARRAALLPNPVEDPATAPYSAAAAPELAEQLGAAPNADTVPPPASPDQLSYPDAETDDDLTMTRPPWHVQKMLAQGQLQPWEQTHKPVAWAPEWHREAAPPQSRQSPGQALPDSIFGPHVMDPSPSTPVHRGRVSSNNGGQRRRALVMIAVIVVVAGGAGTWLLTRDSSKGKAADKVPANATPTQQAPQLDEQNPIITLPETKVIAEKTGKATVAEVRGRSIMYEAEMTALADCGATTGTSQALVAADWSFSGTVFECRDEAAANEDVQHVVGAETTTLKLRPAKVNVPKVQVFSAATNPEFPSYPAQFHIRYASAKQAVGVVVWAKTEQAGKAAVDQVLAQLVVNYPPN